jgi:acetyl esterase
VNEVDPALMPLLADARMAVRPCPPGLRLASYRAAVDTFMAQMQGPDVGSVTDLMQQGRQARLYRPRTPGPHAVILAIHGGGFVFGGLDTHDAIWRHLCASSGAAVFACTYRLAPEHHAPAAEDDCLESLLWLTQGSLDKGINSEKVAIFGDSAGGFLALRTAARAVTAGIALRHVSLAYPCLDPSCSSASQAAFAEDHLMTRAALRWFWDCYLGPGGMLLETPLNLPTTLVLTAEFDPLRDEGEAFAARLAASGRQVTLRRESGMVHGFLGLPQVQNRAATVLQEVGQTIGQALESPKFDK